MTDSTSLTGVTGRDPLADLYAVGNALTELAERLDESEPGTSCLIRLLGQEVRTCTERIDNSTRTHHAT